MYDKLATYSYSYRWRDERTDDEYFTPIAIWHPPPPPTCPRMEGRTDKEYFTRISTHLILPLAHGRTGGGTIGRTDGRGIFYTDCHPPHSPTCPRRTDGWREGRMDGGRDERTNGRGIFYTYSQPPQCPHSPACSPETDFFNF